MSERKAIIVVGRDGGGTTIFYGDSDAEAIRAYHRAHYVNDTASSPIVLVFHAVEAGEFTVKASVSVTAERRR